MNTVPYRSKVCYIDVFHSTPGRLLLVANDERHRELWRRDDPHSRKVLARYKKGDKVKIFEHR